MRQTKTIVSYQSDFDPKAASLPNGEGMSSRRSPLNIRGFSVATMKPYLFASFLTLAGAGYADPWNGPADLPLNERYPLARSLDACEYENQTMGLCIEQLAVKFSEAELLVDVPYSSPQNAMARCWEFVEGIVPEVFGDGITAESFGANWNEQDRYERLPVRRVKFLATDNGAVVEELEFVCRMEAHGMPERLELWISGLRGVGAPLYLKRFNDEEPAEVGALSFSTVKALNVLAGLE